MNNYLIIEIADYQENKLIPKMQMLNITIYDIKKANSNIQIKVTYDDYLKIKKYLKTLKITIVKYGGPIYLKAFFKKYYILIFGFLLGLIWIILSSFLIVDIDIIHEDKELVSMLYDELDKAGIAKFTFRKKYETVQKIKNKIKNNHLDKIEWLEINKVGMKYVVRVEERIINKQSIEENYCSIYAKKDGMITSLKVYHGDAVITLGDYVKKGDLLINGDIKLNDNVVNKVCAKGSVFAEVWYTVNIKVPLKYEEEKITKKHRNNLIINYKDVDYKIFKDRLVNYKTSKRKIFDLLGIKIYLVTDTKVEKTVKKYSEKEALNKAIKEAKEKIKMKLKKDEIILKQKVLQKRLIDSTMEVDIFIVAEEEIGYQEVLKEDTTNDL